MLMLPGEQGRQFAAPIAAPVAYPARQSEQEVDAWALLNVPELHEKHSTLPLLALYLP